MKKISSVLSAMLVVLILINLSPCLAAGAEKTIISATDFSNGIEMNHYGNASEFGVTEYKGNDVLSINKGSSTSFIIGYSQDSVLTNGRYCFSVDMLCENLSALKYFRILGNDISDIASFGSTNSYQLMQFKSDGTRSIRRANTYIEDRTLYGNYSQNQWINIKIWIDTENREFVYIIDDETIAAIPFDETLFEVRGITFVKEGTNTENIYLDNIEFSKENEMLSNGFAPLYIGVKTDESVIGNNFYNNSQPKFSLKIKNRRTGTTNVEIKYSVIDFKGNTLFKSSSEKLSLASKETAEKTVSVSKKYYGRMILRINFDVDGLVYHKDVPYTMSNSNVYNPSSGRNDQRNKKSGVVTHFYNNTGDYKKALPLIANAGIGAMRDISPTWEDIETQKNVYDFSKIEDFINSVNDYGIDYMYLFTTASPLWNNMSGQGNQWLWLPPSDAVGRTALSRYMTALTKWANGRIKWIEVWNEWYNQSMSGCFFGDDGTVYAPLHKAVYDGVHNSETKDYPNVEVVGICGDLSSITPMDKYLSKMKNTSMAASKYFDAISLHPYAKNPIYPEYPIFKNTVDTTKGLLDKYNIDSEIPFYFTECGWSEYMLGYDKELQAAYTVRNLAVSESSGYGDVVFNYNFLEESEHGGHEGSFGVVESYSPGGCEIPYLGKPAYTALANYNTLLGGAKYLGDFDLKQDNTYSYKFETRSGEQVLMLGTIDDSNKTVNLKNVSGITVMDMYGNADKVYTANSVISVKLSAEPTYIIGSNADGISVTDDNPVELDLFAALSGTLPGGVGKENVRLDLYADDNVVYYDSVTSDSDGSFDFAIPTENNCNDEKYRAKISINGDVFSEYDIYTVGDNVNKAAVCINVKKYDMTRKLKIKDRTQSEKANEFVCADVYNNGYSANNLSVENFFDAIYYRNQTVTDSDGYYTFEISVDLPVGDEKELYIKAESGEEKVYRLFNEPASDEITVSVLSKSSEVTEPVIVYSQKDGNLLKGVEFARPLSNLQNQNVYVINRDVSTKYAESIVLFKDMRSLLPIGRKIEF